MPKNRCMLKEMTAIVRADGLDKIMWHVQRQRPLVTKAIVEAMEKVVGIGSILEQQEEVLDVADQSNDARKANLEEQLT